MSGTQSKLARQKPPTPSVDGFDRISTAPAVWEDRTQQHSFVDITYKVAYADGTARIAINRPELHNAFRPITVRPSPVDEQRHWIQQ